MATITGMMLSRADIMNERAEQLKEKLDHARLKRSDSEQLSLISITLTGFVKRYIQNPFMDIINGIIHGVPVQTKFHIAWLRLMVFCTIDFYFGYLVSWHIQESPTSLELYEQNLRSVYKKQRMFCDVIAAIPFCGVLFVFSCRPWIKLLRCVKIVNVMGYLDEINRRSVANELTHFLHVWMMYLLVIHWVACSYLAVATEIKEKRVVTCSEHEMEEHWGAALLLTVQEISRQGQATASGEESAEQEVETSSSTDFKLLSDAVVSRSETTEETSIDDAELPAHLEAMTKVLKTPTTVFKRLHRYFTLC
ncbi:hypothetical protein GN958_ATG15229 [Phytophthora infestans]|uniref:Ion transport domain-containing protein n=1 Tax=Phytophthora infestans TaxID=4787 RepID=A0A8S9U4S2_PHYIN|nr:hypothetical protein GN958_ATG15229 [Phytophthora infestans]